MGPGEIRKKMNGTFKYSVIVILTVIFTAINLHSNIISGIITDRQYDILQVKESFQKDILRLDDRIDNLASRQDKILEIEMNNSIILEKNIVIDSIQGENMKELRVLLRDLGK